MELTAENYFSEEANKEYMSATIYKSYAGMTGRHGCEARAVATLAGEWKTEPDTPMMVGSYVDAWFEGTLDKFKVKHPELFKRDGDLKAEYRHAEEIIARAQRDKMFMGFMSGEKQKIFEGELFGSKWKIKMDSYIPGKAIVDLKVVKEVFDDDRAEEPKMIWVRDLGYVDWMRYWGYDIQGAIYQEITYQNTGERLPFFIAAIDRQKEPALQIFHMDNEVLRSALRMVEANMPRINKIRAGKIEPDRCECCEYCRHTKVLSKVIDIHSGYEGKKV